MCQTGLGKWLNFVMVIVWQLTQMSGTTEVQNYIFCWVRNLYKSLLLYSRGHWGMVVSELSPVAPNPMLFPVFPLFPPNKGFFEVVQGFLVQGLFNTVEMMDISILATFNIFTSYFHHRRARN